MRTRFPQRFRPGLTTAEALGVLVCLGAGIVLGLWLLGEDLTKLMQIATPVADSTSPAARQATSDRSVFQTEVAERLHQQAPVAEEASLQAATYEEPTAEGPTPADPQQPATPAAEAPDSALEINQDQVRALLGEPTVQVTGKPRLPRTQNFASVTAAAPPAASAEAASNTGTRTLTYWNSLNSIIAEEEAMRAAPAGGLTKENAADFIARRGQAGSYASRAIRALDATGVDPAAVKLGSDIAHWYERGTQLNDRANYLYQQADENARRGQAGKSWSSSEKAHNTSVAELNRRGDTLRQQLSQKYQLAFPDLR